MNIEKKTIEVINYQFVAAPSKLVYICDPYTFKLFSYFVERESYWKAKNRLSNGYFFATIEEIGKIVSLSDRKDITCTIEGLFRAKLIDVKCEGLGRGNNNKIANCFKINWEKVNELDRIPFDEITTFNISISKVGRKETLTYTQSSTQSSTQIASNFAPTTLEGLKELEESKELKFNNIYNIENFSEREQIVLNTIENPVSHVSYQSETGETITTDINNIEDMNNRSLDNLNDSRTFEQRNDNSIQLDLKAPENASCEAKNTLSNEDSDIEEFYERETDRMLDSFQTLEDFTIDYNNVLSKLDNNYPKEIKTKYINKLKRIYARTLKRFADTPETGIPTNEIEKALEFTGLKDLYNSLVA